MLKKKKKQASINTSPLDGSDTHADTIIYDHYYIDMEPRIGRSILRREILNAYF